MNIDTYIQATRINVSALCDNDRYDKIWSFLSTELSMKGLEGIATPRLVWTCNRQCEVVTIDGHSTIIYDQSHGEALAKLNQISLIDTGEEDSFWQCGQFVFRRLSELCLMEQDYIGAFYFYKHLLAFKKSDNHDVVTQNEPDLLDLYTFYQELFILAHEYAHISGDRDKYEYSVDPELLGITLDSESCKRVSVITEMIRSLHTEDPKRFVELRCDLEAYLLGTLWVRNHHDFMNVCRYAVLPTIILFRHMMALCVINAWIDIVHDIWRDFHLISTKAGSLNQAFTQRMAYLQKDSQVQNDLALIITRRNNVLRFLRKISSLFSKDEQDILHVDFLPLMEKYRRRIDLMFQKVLFHFLPEHMAKVGPSMMQYGNKKSLVSLVLLCENDHKMRALLSTLNLKINYTQQSL